MPAVGDTIEVLDHGFVRLDAAEATDLSVVNGARDLLGKHYQEAWNRYQELLEMGVARELARLVLPVGIYTEFYWSVNARALMNFIALRNAEQAMWEIRQYGAAVEEFFAAAMPATHAAFVGFGRRAP